MKMSNEYLYGDVDVPPLPADVIMRRITMLEDHKAELYEVPYMQRDTKRIRAIEKAVKFWERVEEV